MTLSRIDDFPPQHPAWELLTGATPFQASSIDQRFSFTTYIPSAYRHSAAPLPLLVAVHGTGRRPEAVRDRFVRFAEEQGVVVLVPLFPIGIDEPDDVDNYKNLSYGGTRFDEVLLGMIADAAERWRIECERFLLAGFSGGGQFAHRFAYLHPERLRAVSIGAPGRVTLPDAEPWPHGIGDVHDVFGRDADLDALTRIPHQIIVGGEDDARETLAIVASDAREARAGVTRVERAHTLARELTSHGVPVEMVVVPGVAHDADAMSAPVIDFLSRALAQPIAI
ncbi:PHB depolymerase family esterase [Microbacterium suwonense]|uniref:Alpha/beta hydrolase n=1 Tax=Microbacterium suwonense TaxID=683047 RepID=A0ABN6X774_9MICO|nr:PHB depolymerase family esterase [Microbacterium suwonense]BDZ40013.1 hypothetical protein GCM10025863_26270 [Microbacterium suwonense]